MELDFTAAAENNSGIVANDFTIAATPHIFKTLYASLYEDAVLVVLGEVAANALDAQRANGTEHVPVKIQLPTELRPEFIVTDCGIGMSQETLLEVYTEYGNSTKRTNNNDIGGFGLGCKSPFSIASGFVVSSVHEGIRTTVGFFVDSGVPKHVHYGSVPTDDPSGTTVTVPVSDKNLQERFHKRLQPVFLMWETPPEITGTEELYEQAEPIFASDRVRVYKDSILGDRELRTYFRQLLRFVAVGPYVYRIPTNARDRLLQDARVNEYLYGYSLPAVDLLLLFNIGELELSPTRERIEDTDHNVSAILAAAHAYIAEVEAKVQAPTLDSFALWQETMANGAVVTKEVDGYGSRLLYTPKSVAEDFLAEHCAITSEDPILLHHAMASWNVRVDYDEPQFDKAREAWKKRNNGSPTLSKYRNPQSLLEDSGASYIEQIADNFNYNTRTVFRNSAGAYSSRERYRLWTDAHGFAYIPEKIPRLFWKALGAAGLPLTDMAFVGYRDDAFSAFSEDILRVFREDPNFVDHTYSYEQIMALYEEYYPQVTTTRSTAKGKSTKSEGKSKTTQNTQLGTYRMWSNGELSVGAFDSTFYKAEDATFEGKTTLLVFPGFSDSVAEDVLSSLRLLENCYTDQVVVLETRRTEPATKRFQEFAKRFEHVVVENPTKIFSAEFCEIPWVKDAYKGEVVRQRMTQGQANGTLLGYAFYPPCGWHLQIGSRLLRERFNYGIYPGDALRILKHHPKISAEQKIKAAVLVEAGRDEYPESIKDELYTSEMQEFVMGVMLSTDETALNEYLDAYAKEQEAAIPPQ